MDAKRFDSKKTVRDVHAARGVACELARRLSQDATEIAALREAVISAAHEARRRRGKDSAKLSVAISAAENISSANASAYEPALMEFVRAADMLAATLESGFGSESESTLANCEDGEACFQKFMGEFVCTCELAELAVQRNGSILKALRSALAVVAAA